MTSLISLIEATFAALDIISIILYILVLITIVRFYSTDFSNSFFALTVSLGIADILRIIAMFLTYKLVLWGFWTDWLLSAGDAIPTGIAFVAFWLGWAEYNGVLLITLNRFNAIVFSTHYAIRWTKSFTLSMIALSWSVSALIAFVVCLPGLRFVPINHNQSLVPLSKSASWYQAYFRITGFYNLLKTLVYCILYGIMFFKLREQRKGMILSKRKRKDKRSGDENNYNARLAMAGFSVVAVEIGVIVYLLARGYLPEMPLYDLYATMLITTGVYAWCNPYVLLALCGQLRRRFMQLFCGKLKSENGQAGKVQVRRVGETAKPIVQQPVSLAVG